MPTANSFYYSFQMWHCVIVLPIRRLPIHTHSVTSTVVCHQKSLTDSSQIRAYG